MFDRFSGSSIRAIMLAQEQARKLGLSQIDTAVVLYGLVAEGKSRAAQILVEAGVNLSLLDGALKKKYTHANNFVTLALPFSTSVERVFSDAKKRSNNMGSQTVEPEFILYELMSDRELYSFFSCSLFRPAELVAGAIFRHLHDSFNSEDSPQPNFQEPNRPRWKERQPYLPQHDQLPLNQTQLNQLPLNQTQLNQLPLNQTQPNQLPLNQTQLNQLPLNQTRLNQTLLDEKATSQAKTLNDWFTREAIEVISQAEDSAQSDGSDTVTVDHLLSALLPACTWLPARVLANFALAGVRSDPPGVRAVKDPAAISFGTDVSWIFVNAQAEAAHLLSPSIGPGHLLLGVFKSVSEGYVEPAFGNATATDELYRLAKVEFYDFLKTQIPTRTEKRVEPLVIDKDRVLATTRFVSTIRRALELAQISGEKVVAVPHLVRAIVESARTSEVTFVQNHTTSLMLVEELLANESPEVHSNIKKRKLRLDKLESIARRATDHAMRLQSNRLDINHLGLALLDENSGAVNSVVEVFGERNSRECVRRRLDWCLLYQRFKTGYQSEVGEVINLRQLDQLYPGT